jgi:glycosyltransferase involved in cell wall biosynthesis
MSTVLHKAGQSTSVRSGYRRSRGAWHPVKVSALWLGDEPCCPYILSSAPERSLSATPHSGNSVSLGFSPTPLVSVVIPTLGRPTLLLRALTSVFNQTYQRLEIIVVVDGPDEATTDRLQSIADPRLHVIVNPRSLTAAGARNVGVDQAKGEWVAFLDDDDEWLPCKLEKQMSFVVLRENILVSCLSRVMTPHLVFIQPDVIYNNSIPLDEYLFDRHSPSSKFGFVQTSSYLVPRSLFDKVRFRTGNPHDDWDFLLRVSKVFRARIETVPEVLVILHVDEPRPSLSSSGTWTASLQWIDSVRPMITRRAYAGFCLGVVGPRTARERAFRGSLLVLYRAFRHGSPRIWRICAFMGFWLLPETVIRRLRTSFRVGIG